jgi:hypothetical protein
VTRHRTTTTRPNAGLRVATMVASYEERLSSPILGHPGGAEEKWSNKHPPTCLNSPDPRICGGGSSIRNLRAQGVVSSRAVSTSTRLAREFRMCRTGRGRVQDEHPSPAAKWDRGAASISDGRALTCGIRSPGTHPARASSRGQAG